MDDHMMDELTLEQRRQMEQMQQTQTVDQRMTQDETLHMGQGLATAQRSRRIFLFYNISMRSLSAAARRSRSLTRK